MENVRRLEYKNLLRENENLSGMQRNQLYKNDL